MRKFLLAMMASFTWLVSGSASAQAPSDQPLFVAADGPSSSSDAAASAVENLERVEVLKGPQGRLYGRNATAGVINVVPTQPKLDELSGHATASYGNCDAFATAGAINLPLGTSSALRVSGMINERDGYLSNNTSAASVRSLRVQLMSQALPDLTLRIAGDYTHPGGNGAGITFLNRQFELDEQRTGVIRAER